MFPTPIEEPMFNDDGAHSASPYHGVVSFDIAETTITLIVAPWILRVEMKSDGPTTWSEPDTMARRHGRFRDARVLSREVYDDDTPEDQEPRLPWEIVELRSYDLGQERWRFLLHCMEIEYVWESSWPELTSLSTALE